MRSAREVARRTPERALLIEMLLWAVDVYGKRARRRYMDFGQFCIMFRACYSKDLGARFKGGPRDSEKPRAEI